MRRYFVLYRKDLNPFARCYNLFKAKKGISDFIPFFVTGSHEDTIIPRRIGTMERIIEKNNKYFNTKRFDFIIKEIFTQKFENKLEELAYKYITDLELGIKRMCSVLVRRVQEDPYQQKRWNKLDPNKFIIKE